MIKYTDRLLIATRSRTITSPSPEPKKQPSTVRPPPTTSKAHARGNSFASSTMSRSGSTATRGTTPNFSATVGYGARGASAMPRPATSFGGRRLNNSIQRPSTSLDTHVDDSAGSVLGKRKGMQPVLSSFTLRSSSGPYGSPGEPDEIPSHHGLPQPVPVPDFTSHFAAPLEQPITFSIATPVRGMSPGSSAARQTQSCSVPALTPSKPSKTTPSSLGRSSKKPQPPLFLSKNSFITNFDHLPDTDWDQDSREKKMDDMMAQVMLRLNQQGHEASGLKDTVEIYKSRSE